MTTLTIPKGLFLEKSNSESIKIWESVQHSLESLVEIDPFDGKSFYALMYLKQETDGTANRHAYLALKIVRPQAVPDSGLFRIIPKESRYELCYYLPAYEHFDAYKKGGALEKSITAQWIQAFEDNTLSDPNDHDFSQSELFMILSGKPYGKSQEEVNAALKKADSRLKDKFKKVN